MASRDRDFLTWAYDIAEGGFQALTGALGSVPWRGFGGYGRHLGRRPCRSPSTTAAVLRGEMSLVGPRPALPEEAAKYDDHVRRRLVVKPGITGLWQVSGRWDLSWDETVRLDLRYIENWSFALDLQILWRTLHGSGK